MSISDVITKVLDEFSQEEYSCWDPESETIPTGTNFHLNPVDCGKYDATDQVDLFWNGEVFVLSTRGELSEPRVIRAIFRPAPVVEP